MLKLGTKYSQDDDDISICSGTSKYGDSQFNDLGDFSFHLADPNQLDASSIMEKLGIDENIKGKSVTITDLDSGFGNWAIISKDSFDTNQIYLAAADQD